MSNTPLTDAAIPKGHINPAMTDYVPAAFARTLEERIADLERQLAEAKAEIEAMRPIVEACRARYEVHNQEPRAILDQCPCLTCQWYRDYLERKQP